jgi:chloramphenicol O-acetyltransferase type A
MKDFSEFAENATKKIARVRKRPRLFEENQERDDLLFMTAIPWVSFTSFMHPLHLNPIDSVPRFAWGKFFQEGDDLKMPLSVQGHHAVMDGLHAGRFYAKVQDYFQQPEIFLGKRQAAA